jgi:hypothetical protein
MPSLDDKDQVVGHVLRELQSGSYVRTYLVLNFETHSLLGYPGNTRRTTDLTDLEPVVQINCQWITKVCKASARPKVLHCLEIGLPTGSQFLSVDSDEEREEWAESIKRCSMGQSSGKPVVVAMQAKKDVVYQNMVVGGKVQKVPVQTNGSGAAEGGVVERSGSVVGGKRTRGFPRVINAGHGIKLGAVMKNWKRRFFVLTEVSLGYYKTIEEADPIRSISVGDMSSCSPSKEVPGKEHMFELVTPSRTYYIQVETEEEVEVWVDAFRRLLSTVRGSHQVYIHICWSLDILQRQKP